MEVQLSNGNTTPFYLQNFFAEGSESFAGKAVLIWKKPKFLRMEILSPFGSPVFVITADGKMIRALSVSQGRYYVGRADPKTMALWMGLPISLEQMVRILQGRLVPTRLLDRQDVRVGWDGELGEIRLEFSARDGDNGKELVFLKPDDLRVRGGRMGEGKEALEVRYGVFRRYGESVIPEWVEIRQFGGRRRLQIRLDGLEDPPAEELPKELFTLHIPPGSDVFPLFRPEN